MGKGNAVQFAARLPRIPIADMIQKVTIKDRDSQIRGSDDQSWPVKTSIRPNDHPGLIYRLRSIIGQGDVNNLRATASQKLSSQSSETGRDCDGIGGRGVM
jgi:hypothetical protein